MKKQKVWVVLGASNGLGAAAVKYLTLNQQQVVAVILDDPAAPEICEIPKENLKTIHVDTSNIQELGRAIKFLKGRYGPIDFIINNSNYKLFSDAGNQDYDKIKKNISASIEKTIALLKQLLPFLRKFPDGNIISIPPQLCLASIEDKAVAEILSSSMNAFLKTLHGELQGLDCTLSFLEPGERMKDFTV